MTENPSIPASAEKLSIVDKYFLIKNEPRIGRISYIARTTIKWLAYLIFVIIMVFLDEEKTSDLTLTYIAGLFTIIFIYVDVILSSKRMHDIGLSTISYISVFLFLPLSMKIGSILIKLETVSDALWLMATCIILCAILLLCAKKGNPGSNKYGPAPTGEPLV